MLSIVEKQTIFYCLIFLGYLVINKTTTELIFKSGKVEDLKVLGFGEKGRKIFTSFKITRVL